MSVQARNTVPTAPYFRGMATHDSTLKLRLSEELRQRIQQKAEERGMSVSEFIREAVETAMAGSDTASLYEAYTDIGGKLVPVRTIIPDVMIKFRDTAPTETPKKGRRK